MVPVSLTVGGRVSPKKGLEKQGTTFVCLQGEAAVAESCSQMQEASRCCHLITPVAWVKAL